MTTVERNVWRFTHEVLDGPLELECLGSENVARMYAWTYLCKNLQGFADTDVFATDLTAERVEP